MYCKLSNQMYGSHLTVLTEIWLLDMRHSWISPLNLIRNNKRFHDCNEKCICTVCNLKCERYHLLIKCKDRILSLKQYTLLNKDNL
jgi:hypothetical protein